jgi:hypothetical protein
MQVCSLSGFLLAPGTQESELGPQVVGNLVLFLCMYAQYVLYNVHCKPELVVVKVCTKEEFV